jgi:hypothetical protein
MIMADLRITGLSNNQLELQAPDGTRHNLEISEDLLKALKSRATSLPKNLTPRDIQTEIRMGTTVAELVARTGGDEDHIAKYAAPILTELNHIVALARNIRLSITGDRFNDPTQIEFGTVMDERLTANQARDISWTSKKTSEGDWLVSILFTINDVSASAKWTFDPKNLLLVPENQAALQLSNSVPLSVEVPANSQLPQFTKHPTNTDRTTDVIEEAATPTTGLSIVPQLEEAQPSEDHTNTEVISLEEVSTKSAFHIVEDLTEQIEIAVSEPVIEIAVPAPVAVQVVEEVEEERTIESVETPNEAAVQQAPEIPLDTNPTIQEQAAKSTEDSPEKIQPAAPSTSRWAEVLFGTKDEEDN